MSTSISPYAPSPPPLVAAAELDSGVVKAVSFSFGGMGSCGIGFRGVAKPALVWCYRQVVLILSFGFATITTFDGIGYLSSMALSVMDLLHWICQGVRWQCHFCGRYNKFII